MPRTKLTKKQIESRLNGELKCISYEKYQNKSSVLEWECNGGHRFTDSYANVLERARKCLSCNRQTKDEMLSKLAADLKCLNIEEYRGVCSTLQWECNEGHIFESTFKDLQKRKAKCVVCKEQKDKQNYASILEELTRIDSNPPDIHKLTSISTWKCKKGHSFEDSAFNILNRSEKCPLCKKNKDQKNLRKAYHEVASKHGGVCLTEQFYGRDTHATWQCKYGHQWEQTLIEWVFGLAG